MSRLVKQARTVFRTTLVDQSRDRRSVGAAFIYALAGPLLLLVMFTMMAGALDKEQPVELAVYGAERAPELVAALQQSGVRVERRSGNADRIAEARPADLGGATVLLLIPQTFEQDMRAERSSRLVVLRDERSRRSMTDSLQIEKQLRGHADSLVNRRLAARGLSEETAQPFVIEDVNISTTGGRELGTAKMIVIFFILAPFFTSMTAAIDSMAGERERQSLKPLIAQPVMPASLIVGKWGVSALFGIAGTAATVVLGLVVLQLAPMEALSITLRSDFGTQMAMIMLLIPLSLAVAALQSLVAMLAKSFKEAQTYIQLLTFAPLGFLMIGTFSDEPGGGAARYLPLTGHADLLTNLMANGGVDGAQATVVTIATLAVTLAALIWGRRQLGNEKLLGQS